MPNRQYSYQYETSPRKISPEYEKQRKKTKGQTTKKQNNKNIDKGKNKNKPKSNVEPKKQENKKPKVSIKTKFAVFLKCVLLFVIMFFIIFRNSQISEKFSQIQNLKTSITDLQKENDQLEINIQNSINLNNIEEAAKALLGMQKRTNKQTVHISLPKKDYVEPKAEEVIIEEDKGFFETIIEKIKNFF